MGIVELLIERRYNLNIWAYARVDTVNTKNLSHMKRAGINWLALGIESANPDVRDSASKRMRVQDIQKVALMVRHFLPVFHLAILNKATFSALMLKMAGMAMG